MMKEYEDEKIVVFVVHFMELKGADYSIQNCCQHLARMNTPDENNDRDPYSSSYQYTCLECHELKVTISRYLHKMFIEVQKPIAGKVCQHCLALLLKLKLVEL